MKKFLALLLLTLSFAASAATTYVCNCDAGADWQCAGNNGAASDSNAGTSTAAPKKTISAIQAVLSSNFAAGDRLLLCEGGSWAGVAGLSIDTSGKTTTAANPFVLGSYKPSWSGAANPLFTFNGTGAAGLSMTGSGTASGFAIKDIRLVGPNGNYTGVALTSGWRFVSMDRLNVSQFMTGVSAVGVPNVALRDSSILNNLGVGVSITSSNVLAERNTIENNGHCGAYSGGSPCPVATLRNSILIAGGTSAAPTVNVTLRDNNITKTSYLGSTCGGPAINGRGNVAGLTIEGNLIYETAATLACAGIKYADVLGNTNEGVTGLVVRSNTIANVGDNFISCAACVGAVIENNSLVNVSGLAAQTRMVGISARSGGTALATASAKVQNNTLYLANSTSATSSAINFAATGTGTGNVVVNNLVRINSGATKCWDTGAKSASDFTTFDYNLCYNLGTGGNTPPSGLNTHGLTTDPRLMSAPHFANKFRMYLSSDSPAVGGGTTGARLAANGRVKTTTDIGAHTGIDTVTNWVTVASEAYPSPSFVFTGTARYGHPSNPSGYIYHAVSGTSACTSSTFAASTDPAPGQYKECQIPLTGANVAQVIDPDTTLTGKPTINTPLLPGPMPGFSTERVITGGGFDAGPFDIGAFRTNCAFSHFSFDDPIIFPNQPGMSHLHMFFGNTGANAYSTPTSILNSGNSTCNGGIANRTGYWVPAMLDMETGTPIVPDGTSWYYKSAYYGVVPESVESFPVGLRMIAGKPNNNWTTPFNEYVRIGCSADGTIGTNSIPDCPVGQTIDIGIQFPQCWDGVNLDSPNHIDHMAYAQLPGGCPAGYHPLAEISLNLHYMVLKPRPDIYMKLSSDNYVGQGGRSMHADWFNGWKQSVMDRWIANCIHLRASSSNALCDGGYLDF